MHLVGEGFSHAMRAKRNINHFANFFELSGHYRSVYRFVGGCSVRLCLEEVNVIGVGLLASFDDLLGRPVKRDKVMTISPWFQDFNGESVRCQIAHLD